MLIIDALTVWDNVMKKYLIVFLFLLSGAKNLFAGGDSVNYSLPGCDTIFTAISDETVPGGLFFEQLPLNGRYIVLRGKKINGIGNADSVKMLLLIDHQLRKVIVKFKKPLNPFSWKRRHWNHLLKQIQIKERLNNIGVLFSGEETGRVSYLGITPAGDVIRVPLGIITPKIMSKVTLFRNGAVSFVKFEDGVFKIYVIGSDGKIQKALRDTYFEHFGVRAEDISQLKSADVSMVKIVSPDNSDLQRRSRNTVYLRRAPKESQNVAVVVGGYYMSSVFFVIKPDGTVEMYEHTLLNFK